MSNEIITPCMASNLITMTICSKQDQRQVIGLPYMIPQEEIRLLRSKLILEEALETIKALGCRVTQENPDADFEIHPYGDPSLEQIIDGCCDLNYVLTGCLASCGVPDVPHIQEVCRANEDKFPDGKAIFDGFGKYLKPEGWKAPNHQPLRFDLKFLGRKLLREKHGK